MGYLFYGTQYVYLSRLANFLFCFQPLTKSQALRYPPHGAPMTVPSPLSGSPPCVEPDGTLIPSCNTTAPESLAPYPPLAPPPSNKTLHFKIDSRPSKYLEHITEYFLNQKPFQLYRAQMAPALFIEDPSDVDPPTVGDLPWGTIVDVIVQNTINETIPLYKHGDPMALLGSQPNEMWDFATVEDAVKAGVKLNLKNPARQLVHDVPPLGWAVLRWQILVRGATMMHSNKFKYYAMGMAAPLLEGMDNTTYAEVPESARTLPHVDFEPKNDGVFG